MAWKGRETNLENFNELLTILANSRLQQSNNAAYQTIYQIITKLQRQKDQIVAKFIQLSADIIFNGSIVINLINSLKDATFWTKDDETLNFPTSIRVVAGPGITLDYTVANVVTVSASGAAGYWTPLTDGDEDETDLIFAAGEAIAVFVPVP